MDGLAILEEDNSKIASFLRDERPALDAAISLDPFRDIQVLSPQVKTGLGVAALNQQLQAVPNFRILAQKRYPR